MTIFPSVAGKLPASDVHIFHIPTGFEFQVSLLSIYLSLIIQCECVTEQKLSCRDLRSFRCSLPCLCIDLVAGNTSVIDSSPGVILVSILVQLLFTK